ncbi:unnamed protein product [Heligmosomoides polygyrus]|uniref:Secreted protein n=1 Tax=Heligmosomoides polygyrus TaxID=6339 RepID=A0A183F8D5_HELPZ|nr:unnamed protein product [Heligmosomoides polygyrus]
MDMWLGIGCRLYLVAGPIGRKQSSCFRVAERARAWVPGIPARAGGTDRRQRPRTGIWKFSEVHLRKNELFCDELGHVVFVMPSLEPKQ